MKGATEELNLTVIAIIAIAAIAAFFTLLWPQVKTKINNSWNEVDNTTLDTNR